MDLLSKPPCDAASAAPEVDQTLALGRQAGLTVGRLGVHGDVDVPADLTRLDGAGLRPQGASDFAQATPDRSPDRTPSQGGGN